MGFRSLAVLVWLACVSSGALGQLDVDSPLDVLFSWQPEDKLEEGQSVDLTLVAADLHRWRAWSPLQLELVISDPHVATIEPNRFYVSKLEPDANWTATVNVTGRFLGRTRLEVRLWPDQSVNASRRVLAAAPSALRLAVVRAKNLVDVVFIATVAILVSVSFVNMGCTLDLGVVVAALKRPVGPAIGFCCQYIFMPLSAFGLSKLLLSHSPALQLGLFITGCSPGGGVSNLWTHMLGGNLHLSITMTGISTVAAFAMMPLWTMTLGRYIFDEAAIQVPFGKIASMAAGFAIPLLIGLLIRSYWPKVANVLTQSLKPLSLVIVSVTIGFGTYANLYMVYLVEWPIAVSAVCLVWLGYGFGALACVVFRQPWKDAVAVAIETGIQNTGIAIFVLRLMLPQPEADINTIAPVAVAMASPLPLGLFWLVNRCVRAADPPPPADEEKQNRDEKTPTKS